MSTSPSEPGAAGLPNRWILGARPKTLPAAVVPVALGTAAFAADAGGLGQVIWWRAGAALVVALALQVGTNFVNDYADGQRGTDDQRVGPVRLVASGLASAKQVKLAAAAAFAVAAVVGGLLALVVGPELFAVGAVSILAGWAYTGGPRPYGYLGLGEVFVFVFFGLVAAMGSYYVQAKSLSLLSFEVAVVAGVLAVALLVVNNLRDIPGDTVAGKRTLAVMVGDGRTRHFYVGLLVVAALFVFSIAARRPGAVAALLALPLVVKPVRAVLAGAEGASLIPVLGQTSRVQLVAGLLLAIGLAATA